MLFGFLTVSIAKIKQQTIKLTRTTTRMTGRCRRLCRLSDPLPAPAPHYVASRDQVLCYVRPTFGFGAVGWPLPPHLTPMLDDGNTSAQSQQRYRPTHTCNIVNSISYWRCNHCCGMRGCRCIGLANEVGLFRPGQAAATVAYAVFGRAVLEGAVLPALVSLVPYWVARPELITRQNSLADRKVHLLVDTLRSAQVCSRQALLEQLRVEPHFLLKPIKQWVVLPKRHLLDRIWPLLVGAAKQSTAGVSAQASI